MTIENLNTIDALERFMDNSQDILFSVPGNKIERYQFIQKELIKFRYLTLPRQHKGLIIRYLIRLTGYSRQQLTRLIAKYKAQGKIHWQPCRSNGFARQYDNTDIQQLVKMDERHDTPSGAVIKKLCERAHHVFEEKGHEKLAHISVSHLYNLRSSQAYKKQRRHFTKTQARQVNIGERRKPTPNGKPGYIRIDTVHQGDQDKQKGVYHINAVDEVTQFEIVCSVEKISEAYLIPALEDMLASFPFAILGFHSDNGSEYINRHVEKLLTKLHAEFTKSRSRHSNDNALAESKNASVVRKHFGYQHIPRHWASRINEFNRNCLNPYINYHKPCYFPETKTSNKGKQVKTYRYEAMMTPYEKLKSLPDAERHLKPEITFEDLDAFALQMSDNEAADLLQSERHKLFELIFSHSNSA